MSTKRLNNLYEEFQKIPSIEKHFQISSHTFQVERKDEKTFQFNASVIIAPIEINLPEDVLTHIKSYLLDMATIEIKYPNDYPFKCPKFSIFSIMLLSNLKYYNFSKLVRF